MMDSLDFGALSVNVEVDVTVKGKAKSLGVQLNVGILVAADPARGGRRCGGARHWGERLQSWANCCLWRFSCDTFLLKFFASFVQLYSKF